MSNTRFDKEEGRKASFETLYKEQKYDIAEIANKLDISVIADETMPNEALGFIRYKNNKFEIVVNNNKKIDKPTTDARVIMTIAHEIAHWIYDYKKIKDGAVLWEKITDDFSDESEQTAMKFAHNVTMGLSNIFPK